MRIWILQGSTVEPRPCHPAVFTDETKARAEFDAVMRSEWEIAGLDDDDGNDLPYPGDPDEAVDMILKNNTDGTWGAWALTEHIIDNGHEDENPFHPGSPEGRAWEDGDRSPAQIHEESAHERAERRKAAGLSPL